MIVKKNILGIGITDATKKEILEYIIKSLENFKKKLFLVTPNPEFLVLANKNPTFKNILNRADLASADGIGVLWAAKFLDKPLRERFTGMDLVKSLCKEVSEKPITVGFLGGRGNVAEKTAECLRKECPGLKVVFAQEEWPNGVGGHAGTGAEVANKNFLARSSQMNISKELKMRAGENFISSPRHNNLAMKQFNNGTVDILFVAFGAPKQEFWISENLDKIPVKIAIGVGGAFDYISGKIPRAPSFIRSIGLEWLFRLVVQPRRIKRQLALIEFIWLVLKEKLK